MLKEHKEAKGLKVLKVPLDQQVEVVLQVLKGHKALKEVLGQQGM